MRVGTARKPGHLPNGAIRIGTVARRFGVSVDLLRLYEREGLLIPLKSPRGTRYYGEHDFAWIQMLLRLIREVRLNCAGIRRLLALLPCWKMRQCAFPQRAGCPLISDPTQPCWMNCRCAHQRPDASPLCGPAASLRDCYFCAVYRSAPANENLAALLAPSPPVPANVLARPREDKPGEERML